MKEELLFFVLSGQRNLPVRGGADWAGGGCHGADSGGRACTGKGQVERYWYPTWEG